MVRKRKFKKEFRDEDPRLKTQIGSFKGLVLDEVQKDEKNLGIAVTFNSRNSNKSVRKSTKNSDIQQVTE